MPNPCNDAQFRHYHNRRKAKGKVKVRNEKRQSMPDSTQSRHGSANDATNPRVTTSRQASIIRRVPPQNPC